MLTGQAPFSQGTALQKLLQHQSERPPEMRTFRSDIPDSVSRLVRRMLAKAPGDRQQTPVDLVNEISEIVEELGAPLPYAAAALPWTPPVRSNPRWRKHAAWAAPLIGLLALAVVVDRVSRDDAGAAPFPALQSMPQIQSTPGDSPDSTAGATADIDSPQSAPTANDKASNSAERTGREYAAPLVLPDSWAPGTSLWDSVVNWPATTAAQPRDRGLNESEMPPQQPVDVGMWSAPLLPASPMIDLDLDEIRNSDDEASIPPAIQAEEP
jgi:serine/threonine protein kinase